MAVVWGPRIYFNFLLTQLEIIIIQYMIKIKRATFPFRLLWALDKNIKNCMDQGCELFERT